MNSFTKQKETRRHRKQTSGYQRRGSEVSEVGQSCPTLRNPMDSSLPGSAIHGIFQARILEWAAISFSGDLPNPGIEPVSPALRTDTLPSEPPGKPKEEEAGNKPRVGINRHTLNKQDTH